MSTGDDFSSASPVQRDILVALAPSLLIAFLLGGRSLIRSCLLGAPVLEDDAYYYLVIARHIVMDGVSSFDGQTLTNGYHPLWLLLVTAETWLFGSTPGPMIVTEVLLVAGAVQILSGAFATPSLLLRVAFATGFGLLAWPLVARGMEVSLFLFGFALFLRATLAMRDEGRGRALAAGLAATLAIGARIDSAVFVLPIALLSIRSVRRDGLGLIAPLTGIGAAYAAFNLWIFGIAFPISGAVKSLGGLQFNAALLHQTLMSRPTDGELLRLIANSTGSLVDRMVIVLALCFLALPFVKPTCRAWPLLVGLCIGSILFFLKLLFFSSWVVWPWYTFPVLLGYATLFLLLDEAALKSRDRIMSVAAAVLSVFAGVTFAIQSFTIVTNAVQLTQARYPNARQDDFQALNRLAVREWSARLAGARVAMGDRAGSFAAAYEGPVTQLEGLVNDVEYLRALQGRKDLRPLLCQRGVRFVVAYQRDLGDYEHVVVPVQRPVLTSYASPALIFAKIDEVGHVHDPAVFSHAEDGEGDSHLYLWRLRCG